MTEQAEPDQQGVSISRQLDTESEPSTVWAHLTDGDLVNVWMEGEIEIDVRPGGDIRLRRDGSPDVWGTVEESRPPERIQWSWRTDDGMPTLVEIDLIRLPRGTRVVVKETLLPWRVSGPDGFWEGPVASAGNSLGSRAA